MDKNKLHIEYKNKTVEYQDDFWVVPLPTPKDISLSEQAVHLADYAEKRLTATEVMVDATDTEMLTQAFLTQEVVNSSQIEGSKTTALDVKYYEATAEQVKEDTPSVTIFKDALADCLKSTKSLGDLGEYTIRNLHNRLFSADPNFKDIPGEYRKTCVTIKGDAPDASYNPPPPFHVKECMDDLLKWIKSDNKLPLVAKLAVLHAQFEMIHPFPDGNGRVGRSLMPLFLKALKHPPVFISGYIQEHRDAYYDGFKEIQQKNNWNPLIILIAEAITVSSNVVENKGFRILRTVDKYKQKVKDIKRKPGTLIKIINELPRLQVITRRSLGKEFGISFQGASEIINVLLDLGILYESKKQVKFKAQAYVAKEILKILDIVNE